MQLPIGFTQEQVVDGQRAAEFLGLPRKTLLNLAGRGSVPAHPIGDGMRHTSRFRHAGEAPTLMSILDDSQNQSAAQSQFEPLLDPKQAAVLLRVHQKTLVRLAREGPRRGDQSCEALEIPGLDLKFVAGRPGDWCRIVWPVRLERLEMICQALAAVIRMARSKE